MTIYDYQGTPIQAISTDYDRYVKAVAHRGLSAVAPENTLPAYIEAKKAGFNYVETDISFTSDGVPVCLHDSTIDRTSNGSGNINSLTFNTVRTYDFGSWKSPEYANTQIPSFEEFIKLCRDIGLYPYIELKQTASYTESQIKSLIDMVKAYGMSGKVTWISFSSGFLNYVKNNDSSARIGYVVSSVNTSVIATAQGLETSDNEVFIDTSAISDSAVVLCANANLPMEAWTIDNASTILSLNPYITGVTSNQLIAGKLFYENSIQ